MSEYRYYIKKIEQPSPDQVIFEAGDKNGQPVFNFRPGQYAMISYRNTKGQIEDKHAFSIASSPDKNDSILFGIRVQGSFTRGLLNLKVGDELNVFGPYGNFCYDENKYSDSVMIAGGIGITPFFSALNYASNLKLNNKLSLIYSARTKNNATFYNEIKNLKDSNQNISALFSFTDETDNSADKDIINKRIDAKIIKDFVGNVEGKTFFICGPGLFMAAMVANLLSLGVSRKQIKMEEFSMIPDSAFLPRLRNFSYALAFSALIFIISFFLIYKPTKATTSPTVNIDSQKKYDQTLVNNINQSAYNRMIAIYNAKNKAITDLNQQILAATNQGGKVMTTTQSQSKTSTAQPGSASQPAINNIPSVATTPVPVINTPVVQPIQTPTPVYTPPAPVYTPPAPVYTPAPTPAPTPVTSASPVR
jgi:ferredoxin-NADP reductase